MRSIPLVLLLSCAIPETEQPPQLPPPALSLEMSALAGGTAVDITVSGASPGASVTLMRANGGEGAGACPPFLGGLCLGMRPGSSGYVPTLTGTADAAGTVSWSFPSFIQLPLTELWFQAAVASAGSSAISNVLYRPITPLCGPDTLEPNDSRTASSPGAATLGGLTMCYPSERDYVAYTLTVGTTYLLEQRFDHAEGAIEVALFDDAGAYQETAAATATGSSMLFSPPASGTYHLRMTLLDDAGPRHGIDYALRLTTLSCSADAYEPNDSRSAAAMGPSTASGLTLCSPGDRDYFSYDLSVGTTYLFEAAFPVAEGAVEINLFDANGAFLAGGTPQASGESFTYAPAVDGTVWLRAELIDDPGQTGNTYGLSVSALSCAPDVHEPDDSFASAPAGTFLMPDLSLCAVGDDDYFALQLQAGVVYAFDIPFDAGEGDLVADLRRADATVEVVSDANGDGEAFTFVPATSGTYVLRTSLQTDEGTQTGNSYDVNISIPPCSADPYDPAGWFGAPVEGPTSASGLTLCLPGDRDFYRYDLVAGTAYVFRAQFAHTAGDLDLTLYGADGSYQAGVSSDTDNEVLTFAPTTAGSYVLAVELSDDPDGVPGATYQLQVTP